MASFGVLVYYRRQMKRAMGFFWVLVYYRRQMKGAMVFFLGVSLLS